MALKTNAIAAQLRQARERIERTERNLAAARSATRQARSNFNDLVAGISSDHHAATCQSTGQYRGMLLQFASQIIAAETDKK